MTQLGAEVVLSSMTVLCVFVALLLAQAFAGCGAGLSCTLAGVAVIVDSPGTLRALGGFSTLLEKDRPLNLLVDSCVLAGFSNIFLAAAILEVVSNGYDYRQEEHPVINCTCVYYLVNITSDDSCDVCLKLGGLRLVRLWLVASRRSLPATRPRLGAI